MYIFHSRYLFLSALLVNVFQAGTAIQCHSCDSISSSDCGDPYNETLFSPIQCENENFVCVKQEKINKELNRTYLFRGCIQKHYCEILAKAADFCITCTTELCNSYPELLPSFVLVFASLLWVVKCI